VVEADINSRAARENNRIKREGREPVRNFRLITKSKLEQIKTGQTQLD
jgi:hypothetical protein